MKVALLKWLTVAFAALLASSFLSMMAVFSGSTGGDLRDLLNLQAAAIPVAIVAAVWSFCLLARTGGYRQGLRRFRVLLPGWLLFILCLAMALVAVAELSFMLVLHHNGGSRPWQEHVPVAAAFFSTLALAACYTAFQRERE